MATNKILAELIEISNIVGRDGALVQGGGGNTSAKSADGKYMYIKASGAALKDMSVSVGWRRLDLSAVLDIVRDKKLIDLDVSVREDVVVARLNLACDDGNSTGARPSVEAHLHGLLDNYVIHLHPQAVGAYVNAKGGRELVEELFKADKRPPVWTPYVDPGITLAHTVERLICKYQRDNGCRPSIIFMEKHGLFVTAATAKKALNLVRKVIRRCNSNLTTPEKQKITAPDPQTVSSARLAIRSAVYKTTGKYVAVSHFINDQINSFTHRKDVVKLLGAGPLTPDEIVYANGAPLWLNKYDSETIAQKLRKQIDKGDKPAVSFLVKGLGLFVACESKTIRTVFDVAVSSMFIRSNAADLGGLATLSARQRAFINNWEAESYRKQLVGGCEIGSLNNKIAVVTGAGSGLGRGIALGLARDGAMTAICDIDLSAALETVEIIKKENPSSVAVAIKCNVTDEDSVDGAFSSLLDVWGGLDVLVNAAGVAPAYPLTDFPLDKWRFALEVNLTGYFLMARAAARIMIDQGMGGNIVNVSSKSGVDASKNNSAYNATKAGELHLTRGWAMELGQYGVRVNSVCPGNVFEGSKIWNTNYIKECAKKYGIKPEEVIPYYVDKTMLRREIVGRDIADAVSFLASEKSRVVTAQTLIADSGQAVVR